MPRLLIVLLSVAFALQSLAAENLVSISAAQRTALRIATTPVEADAGGATLGVPATVMVPPEQERFVAAPVGGLVTELRVGLGDPVTAGKTLLMLRSQELAEGQRGALEAATRLRLAESAWRRDEALFKDGIIAESRLQATEAALAQARAAQKERRAWLKLMGFSRAEAEAVERGERLFDSVRIAAPIAGNVVELTASSGMRLEAMAPLLRLVRTDPVWLDIRAPSALAAQLRKGQKVRIAGSEAVGTVLAVGRAVDAAQTVPVRARIANPNGGLRLNQGVEVRFEGLGGAGLWRIPSRALVYQQGQAHVFVERNGGFEPLPVKIVAQGGQSLTIAAPFKAGERVAIEGVAAIKSAWLGGGGE